MTEKMPDLYVAIHARLDEVSRDPAVQKASATGAIEALRVFMNWHTPGPQYVGRPTCTECTGENIVSWPCGYAQQVIQHLGIKVYRGPHTRLYGVDAAALGIEVDGD